MTKDEPATIGAVKWVIVETATGKTISKGEKSLRVSDVTISTKSDLYEKQIALPEKFYFSLCDNATRDKEPSDGFGLAGGRYGEEDFSWDWFQVDRTGHATKLQESGELSFDTKKTQNGAEIHRMEFLTDVSIRISRVTGESPLKPRWRVNILKGSFVNWTP